MQVQSLPRDLSLSSEFELLQHFVPELQTLRAVGGPAALKMGGPALRGSPQLEIRGRFTFDATVAPREPFGIAVLCGSDGKCARLVIDCTAGGSDGLPCTAGVDATAYGGHVVEAPLLHAPGRAGGGLVTVHAFLDGGLLEVIFNNRTAVSTVAPRASEDAVGLKTFGPGPQDRASPDLVGLASRLQALGISIFLLLYAISGKTGLGLALN